MSTQGDEVEEVKNLTRYQLSAIVWPIRTPKDESFVEEFAIHIRDKFNEPSVKKFSKELQDFSNLRNSAINGLNQNSLRDISTLNSLKRYYCQLSSMLVRFKDCKAEFTWTDSFSRSNTNGNIEFELNNIMYNIAAVYNELGAKIPRNSDSSMKEACANFRSALWWVTELRDNRAGLKPKEMGHDLLTFYHHVLKAQSQECVLSHSIQAGMSFDIVAKISAQIANDYDVCTKLAQTPLYTDPLKEILSGGSIFQTWRATVDFKQRYFSSLTQLLMGLASKDDNAKEIGLRIVRLRMASQHLENCKKIIPDTLDHQTTRSAFDLLGALISKKLDKAIKYNDNVYHSSIPSGETLPAPECKLLISPAPFSVSSMPDFKDIFSSLVTIEAIQTSSIYTERKDDIARKVKTKVAAMDEQLAQMMSTLNIDKRSLRLPPVEAPDELVEICAELSMNPNIVDDVLTKLEQLDDKSEEIQRSLDRVQSMLHRRPNRQFEEELRRFKETHMKALQTTQSLHKQLYPEIQQQIQLLSSTSNPLDLLPPVVGNSTEDEEIIRKLEKLLDKVDEMKQQRSTLLSQLVQSLNQDEVINHVVAASSEHEIKNVFDKEIEKHSKYMGPLVSNLDLQGEMLDTLERVNAQYGQVKLNRRSQKMAYVEKVESYKKVYSQFKSTMECIDQGLEYHRKMLDLVTKFVAKVRAAQDLHDLIN